MIKKWYAAYTRFKWEKKVAATLIQHNIECYCPLNKVVHQWHDRKKMVLEPLFKSYVFVRVTEKEQVHVKMVDGVLDLVHWNGKPAAIRDEEITVIRNFLEEHTDVQVGWLELSKDDMVMILNGQLGERQRNIAELGPETVKVTLPSLGLFMTAEVKSLT